MVCLFYWSGVFSLYRMPLRSWFSVYGAPSTSLLRSSAFVGCVSLTERISLKLAVLRYQVISRRWIELFPVMLHSSSRRAVTTTTAFVRLSSLARTDLCRSTVGSRTFTASGAAYGTTCRLTSQLRRHLRSSNSALRHFSSRDYTLILSLNL